MMNSTEQIARAIQDVVAMIQERLESGERSARINAHDLIEVLLAIAERIEAQTTDPE